MTYITGGKTLFNQNKKKYTTKIRFFFVLHIPQILLSSMKDYNFTRLVTVPASCSLLKDNISNQHICNFKKIEYNIYMFARYMQN